jgi:hypothetical protein
MQRIEKKIKKAREDSKEMINIGMKMTNVCGQTESNLVLVYAKTGRILEIRST